MPQAHSPEQSISEFLIKQPGVSLYKLTHIHLQKYSINMWHCLVCLVLLKLWLSNLRKVLHKIKYQLGFSSLSFFLLSKAQITDLQTYLKLILIFLKIE